MNKLFVPILVFVYSLSSIAQVESQETMLHKIDLHIGIAGTTFFEKVPLEILVCSTASCLTAVKQRGIPALTFGGSVAKRVGNKHYLGIGYQWTQIRFEQSFEVYYQEELLDLLFNFTYHSYSIHHQMTLKEDKDKAGLFWNNDVGIEKLRGGRNIFKQPLFFYRTGLDIGKSWKKIGLYATPFLEFDVAQHVEETGRPINYGIRAKVTISY